MTPYEFTMFKTNFKSLGSASSRYDVIDDASVPLQLMEWNGYPWVMEINMEPILSELRSWVFSVELYNSYYRSSMNKYRIRVVNLFKTLCKAVKQRTEYFIAFQSYSKRIRFNIWWQLSCYCFIKLCKFCTDSHEALQRL